MSILGYSSAYFLPEYWGSTPLYGEKIIPLIDYILSTDFSQADKLANAFYNIEKKYKNTGDLPIEFIKEIIIESGYDYVLDLLGEDEASIKLLVYLIVLIHQLKGTGLGIEVVLNLLKRDVKPMILSIVGDPQIINKEVTGFSSKDYVYYSSLTFDTDPFEITFPIRTLDFRSEQCIASIPDYSLYLGISTAGNLILSLGSDRAGWDIANRVQSIGALSPNSTYYIKLSYDGFEYTLKVSPDNKKFSDYIVINSNIATNIRAARLYLGINSATAPASNPFNGFINLAPFSVDVNNIKITQWFETTPVDEENTFMVAADLDLALISTDFFEKFSIFVSKYVYPTLKAFDVKLKLDSNLTFIPVVREKITYAAKGDVDQEIEDYKDHNN